MTNRLETCQLSHGNPKIENHLICKGAKCYNKAKMNERYVKDFIARLSDLSTIPDMLGKIICIIRDENSSPQDLYTLISHDQSLAERVVRIANSAIFGHSGEVKEIRQAIMFLGCERIKSIAMGMSIMEIFPSRNSFNLKRLWIHSYEVAFISAMLSEITPISSPSETFLAGLLHDIGRIILYKIDPKRFLEIKTTDDMFDREIELFGCTHMDAGSWFAEGRGLPEEIVYSIRYHHKPSLADKFRDIISIVSLAEALSRVFSPKIEDDGIWSNEHSAILLEYSLKDDHLNNIKQQLDAAKPDIQDFFSS